MVVGFIQPQGVKLLPKKQEAQPSETGKSFESLMNDRVDKENSQKAPEAKDKDFKKASDTESPVEKEDPKDTLEKAIKALQDSAAIPLVPQDLSLEMSAATVEVPIAQNNAVEQIVKTVQTVQAVQQEKIVQVDGGLKAAEDLVVPQETPKAQNVENKPKADTGLSGESETQQAAPQMKIPFEKILESGQDVKIPVVNTAQKSQGTAVNVSDNALSSNGEAAIKTAQSPVQEKAPVTQEPVNVMPQQPITQTLDPDKINIKVGEAVDTKSETFATDFADKVVYKINQDVKEFEIELNPQNMGKVTIKVAFAAEKAFVSMNCENAKTQSLLAQSSDTIRSIIQQNVGSETVVVVQQQPQQQTYQQPQQQNQQPEQEGQRQQKQTPSEDSLTFVNQLRLGLVDVDSKL